MADPVVFDASVIIDFARGVQAAREFAIPLLERRMASVHPVAAAEVLAGSRSRREWVDNESFLRLWRPVAVRNSDWPAAFSLLADVHLSHGTGWPDCLIAATAVRLGLTIATVNDKHFRPIRGLKVVRPY